MKNKNIYYHIILILLLLLIPVLSSPELDSNLRMINSTPFQRDFSRYVLLIVFFYLNLAVFLPKLYDKRRLLLYWVCVFVSYVWICTLPFFVFPDNHGSDPRFDFFQNEMSNDKNVQTFEGFPPSPFQNISPEEREKFEKENFTRPPKIRPRGKGFPPPKMMDREDSFSRKYISGLVKLKEFKKMRMVSRKDFLKSLGLAGVTMAATPFVLNCRNDDD